MSTAGVRATNADVSSKKLHAVKRGYIDDPYVECFIQDATYANSPLMNRGCWLRVKTIESIVSHFVAAGGQQIVNLGAGYDTMYFRRHSVLSKLLHYVEMDVDLVTSKKKQIIESHEGMKEMAFGEGSNYAMCSLDLNDVKKLEEAIRSTIKDVSQPTLVLSECVLVYLEPESSDEILHTIKTIFPSVVVASYDGIEPNDRFGKIMHANLQSRGCPMLGVYKYPSVEAHLERYKTLGFGTWVGMTMKQIYQHVSQDEAKKINAIEMLDELEEWNLMHSHYAVTLAADGSVAEMMNLEACLTFKW